MDNKITNVLFAGIGGQGIIKASDMLTEAAFRMGYDVKKSELHGMSQRGGSVSSDVRFGKKVVRFLYLCWRYCIRYIWYCPT